MQVTMKYFVFFNCFLLEHICKKPIFAPKVFLPFNIDCEDRF